MPMGATRPKPEASEGTQQFPLERARGRLSLAVEQGEAASELSRGLAELAAAHGSPLIVVASRGRLASSLRTARLLGMEPRVVAPAGQPGLPARLTLSLPLRGTLGNSARAAAVAYVAAFADAGRSGAGSAGGTGGAGSAGSRPLAAPLAEAIGRATARLGNAFTFEGLADAVQGMSAFRGTLVASRLQALHAAEQHAGVFTTPVPWSRVLSPSPRGRPAALWLDLSSLGPEAARRVGGLALASLAATAPDWGPATGGHPPVVLAQGVDGPVGAFALERLLGPTPPAPLFGLLVEDAPDASAGLPLPGVASAYLADHALAFDGLGEALPLPDATGTVEPLTATEREALTPLTLRDRMVGAGGEEDEDGGAAGAAGAAAASAEGRASSEALQHASGDLGRIAREGIRRDKRRSGSKHGDYEAGDFDLG